MAEETRRCEREQCRGWSLLIWQTGQCEHRTIARRRWQCVRCTGDNWHTKRVVFALFTLLHLAHAYVIVGICWCVRLTSYELWRMWNTTLDGNSVSGFILACVLIGSANANLRLRSATKAEHDQHSRCGEHRMPRCDRQTIESYVRWPGHRYYEQCTKCQQSARRIPKISYFRACSQNKRTNMLFIAAAECSSATYGPCTPIKSGSPAIYGLKCKANRSADSVGGCGLNLDIRLTSRSPIEFPTIRAYL